MSAMLAKDLLLMVKVGLLLAGILLPFVLFGASPMLLLTAVLGSWLGIVAKRVAG
jgi:hypothetical protein